MLGNRFRRIYTPHPRLLVFMLKLQTQTPTNTKTLKNLSLTHTFSFYISYLFIYPIYLSHTVVHTSTPTHAHTIFRLHLPLSSSMEPFKPLSSLSEYAYGNKAYACSYAIAVTIMRLGHIKIVIINIICHD
jgi:hypothetical protein